MSAHAKPLLMQRESGGVNKTKGWGGASVDKRWAPVDLSNHGGSALETLLPSAVKTATIGPRWDWQ